MSHFLTDFHTHTTVSDGALLPEELLRRVEVMGYYAIALTDHVGWSNCASAAEQAARACEKYGQCSRLIVVPGVEITHVPPEGIAEVAALAKRSGARLVVVHGETPVEPVAPGTNHAALCCPYVDILAHPGFLTDEEAALAAERGVFVELTGRKGHSLTNGHVTNVGRRAGVAFLIDSDAHDPGDLMSFELARRIGLGAGLDDTELAIVMQQNPKRLLERVQSRQ